MPKELLSWQPSLTVRLLTRGRIQLKSAILENRFGRLPEWVQKKIAAASADTREQWLLHLLKANSLEELLQAPPKL